MAVQRCLVGLLKFVILNGNSNGQRCAVHENHPTGDIYVNLSITA